MCSATRAVALRNSRAAPRGGAATCPRRRPSPCGIATRHPAAGPRLALDDGAAARRRWRAKLLRPARGPLPAQVGGPAARASCFVVDLPGVGHARRSKDERSAFGAASAAYLANREKHVLREALVLCDARRGPCADLLDAFAALRVSHRVVLTKADLATPADVVSALSATRDRLAAAKHACLLPVVHVVSAKTGAGVAALRAHIAALVTDEDALPD